MAPQKPNNWRNIAIALIDRSRGVVYARGPPRPRKKSARKQSKKIPVKTCDEIKGIPKVNQRQAGYIQGLAEGKSKLDAALQAGYASSVPFLLDIRLIV